VDGTSGWSCEALAGTGCRSLIKRTLSVCPWRPMTTGGKSEGAVPFTPYKYRPSTGNVRFAAPLSVPTGSTALAPFVARSEILKDEDDALTMRAAGNSTGAACAVVSAAAAVAVSTMGKNHWHTRCATLCIIKRSFAAEERVVPGGSDSCRVGSTSTRIAELDRCSVHRMSLCQRCQLPGAFPSSRSANHPQCLAIPHLVLPPTHGRINVFIPIHCRFLLQLRDP
jgi:hypothetical protein